MSTKATPPEHVAVKLNGSDYNIVQVERPMIEGRVFFYNFDFLRFRGEAEESTRPLYPFLLQGVCYKFHFAGQVRVFVEGKRVIDLPADELANGFTLPMPFQIKADAHVCVQVADTQPRWFRWSPVSSEAKPS